MLTIWVSYLGKSSDTTFYWLIDSRRRVCWLEQLILLLDACLFGGYSIVLLLIFARLRHNSIRSRMDVWLNVFLVENGDSWLHHMVGWKHVRNVHIIYAIRALEFLPVAMLLCSNLESILLTKRAACLESWWFWLDVRHHIILAVNWAQELVIVA